MKVSKRLLKNFAAAAIIALLFFLTDLRELMRAFSHLTFSAVFLLLLISVLLIYTSALKWSLFLAALSRKVPVARLFCLYLVGYFVNLIVPSYVGGDAVRSFYVGRQVGQHEAFTATILERYTGLVAMLFLALVCMWVSTLVTWQIKVALVVVTTALIVVTLLALSKSTLAYMRRFKPLMDVVHHLERIQEGFHLVQRDWVLLLKALLLSFIYHAFTVINTAVAGWAVGWQNPALEELFVVLPIVLLIGSLPLSPSGLGIQEGAFFYFLQGIGASPAEALGVGLILRAKSYLVALLGGLFWLAIPKEERQRKAPSSY